MSKQTMHIGMRTANHIFTRAQSSNSDGLIGILRSVDSDQQEFISRIDDSEAMNLNEDDMPVFLEVTSKELGNRDHLLVITDTRGVMQLRGYRCDSDGCDTLELITDDAG